MEIEDKYLTSENTKENDIITFLDEGVKADMEQRDGSIKKVNNFQVSNGSYELIYTPNLTALKIFIKAWGRETTAWIGKKFAVKHALLPNNKYMIIPQMLKIEA